MHISVQMAFLYVDNIFAIWGGAVGVWAKSACIHELQRRICKAICSPEILQSTLTYNKDG